MAIGPLLSLVPKFVHYRSRGAAVGFVNTIALSDALLSSFVGGYIIKQMGGYQLIWIIFSGILLFSVFVLHPLVQKN